MSNKRKLRVPGRYERPAGHRAELGDHAGEAAIRRQYAIANRGRVRNNRRADELLAAGGLRVRQHPVVVDDITHDQVLDNHRQVLATVESAGPAVLDRPAEVELREASVALTDQPGDGPTGRLVTAVVIRSGWNSSGSRYYPAEVLERDVPKIYGKGTQVFIDHPRLSEQDDIPERSLTTLAGVFEDDPWPVREADGTLTMRTNVRVYAPWQPLIREAWQSIGLSINGGGRGEYGERDGRDGTIIEALTYGRSVDFVTVPGAGGRVLALMESHRPGPPGAAPGPVATREAAGSLGAYVESRIHLGFTELGDEMYGAGYVTRAERITLSGAIGDALGAFVRRLEADAPQLYQRGRYDGPPQEASGDGDMPTAEAEQRTREATGEQTRMALDKAVGAAYGGEGCYSWVEDVDPAAGLVWFTAGHHDGRAAVYQQSYVTSGGTAVLTGDRVEVRRTTVFVPVNAPGAVDGPPAAPAGGYLEAGRPVRTALVADVAPYLQAASAVAGAHRNTSETTAGGVPAADDGPLAPGITTKEGVMPEKTEDIVAREAAEARATAAELELARYRAGDTARPIVDQLLAESELPEAAKNKIRSEFGPAALPLRESDRGLDDGALRTQVGAAIKAEKAYVDSLLEAAGAGTVRGAGPAAGAGAGMPVSYAAPAAGGAGVPDGGFFGFGGPARPAPSEAEVREAAATREQLIQIYMQRGNSRQAAELAVDADV